MNCANCARPLLSADAVCAYCEPEIRRLPPFTFEEDAADQAAVPDDGDFACPACAKHFDQCLSVMVPEKARWRQPQGYGLACPHCQTVLRWQTSRFPLATHRLRGFSTAMLFVFVFFQWMIAKDATHFWFAERATAVYIGIWLIWWIALSGTESLSPYQGVGHFVRASDPDPWHRQWWWSITVVIASLIGAYLVPSPWLPYLWLGVVVCGITSALAAVVLRFKK